MPEHPNARFWVFVNMDHVKLTLKPGQSLGFGEGGRHDEGYSWTDTRWKHHGDTVECTIDSEDRDCDGPHSDHRTLGCPINSLQHRWNKYANRWQPMWEVIDSHQRDYFAEAAGY